MSTGTTSTVSEPLTAAEEAWVRERFASEREFIEEMGLSFDKEDEREEGRIMIRGIVEANHFHEMEALADAEYAAAEAAVEASQETGWVRYYKCVSRMLPNTSIVAVLTTSFEVVQSPSALLSIGSD